MGESPIGMSRRQALKQGALVSGNATWVTPDIQVITLSATAAEQSCPGSSREIDLDRLGGVIDLRDEGMRIIQSRISAHDAGRL